MSGNEEDAPQDKCHKDKKFPHKTHGSDVHYLTQSMPAMKANANFDQLSQNSPVPRRISESISPSAKVHQTHGSPKTRSALTAQYPEQTTRSDTRNNAESKASSNQATMQKEVNLLVEKDKGSVQSSSEPRVVLRSLETERREVLNVAPDEQEQWGGYSPEQGAHPAMLEGDHLRKLSARGAAEHEAHLRSDMTEQRLRSERNRLRMDLEDLVHQKARDQEMLSAAEDEIHRLHAELDETKKKQTLEMEKAVYYESQARMHKSSHHKLEEENDKLQLKIKTLTDQLGKQMLQKVSGDESTLENINSANRPSKIAESYQEMMSSLWLNAKEELDELYPEERKEETKLRFLNSITMLAENIAQTHLKRYRAVCESLLSQPLFYIVSQARGAPSKMLDDFNERLLGADLKSALVNYLKDTSASTDVQQLEEDVYSRIKQDSVMSLMSANAKKMSAVGQYITEMCSLSWRMVTQTPPMNFNTSGVGDSPATSKHEIYYSCPKKGDQVISTFVYPVLEHKGKCLIKGKVFTLSKKDYKAKK